MASQGPSHRPQNIVAQEANIRNVEGAYYDNSRKFIVHSTYGGTGAIDRLLQHVATGALHDSAERGGPDAPKCHPETRTAVQTRIMTWIKHGDQDNAPKRILWLSGPAGSGKTAIAGTIADKCYEEGLLAASFFFSAFVGSANRRWKRPVIPTLVYRLIQHKSIVGLKDEVLAVIEDDPGVFERRLDQQLEELILKPLRRVSRLSNHKTWPPLFLIDGLDECQGDPGSEASHSSWANAQKEILAALSRACKDPAFPFRIIIASRPEPAIRHFFATSSDLSTLDIFLDDKYDPDADIRLFLRAMLDDIGIRHGLPESWADDEAVDLLVREASGQFIYAATVVRFLNDDDHPPGDQLERVLEWRRSDTSQPFAPLDALYSRILHTSPKPLLAVKWLRVIDEHLSNGVGSYTKQLLETYPGETRHVLGNIASLVKLPSKEGGPDFHFYHKSLLDFLKDKSRSSDLHVTEQDVTHFRTDRYYEVLQGRGSRPHCTYALPEDFLGYFCRIYEIDMDRRKPYSQSDVEWWLANVSEENRDMDIPCMFASIHEECGWSHLPACKVWRKGILKYCKERGWRLPTEAELLRDRMMKFVHEYDLPGPDYDYPLRPPPQQESGPISSDEESM